MSWLSDWKEDRLRRRVHRARLDKLGQWVKQKRVAEIMAFLEERPSYTNHIFSALGDIGNSQAVAAIAHAASTNPNRAADALERIGSPEAVEVLIRLVPEGDEGPARRALQALYSRLSPDVQSRVDQALAQRRALDVRLDELRAGEEKARKDGLRWCPRCGKEPAPNQVMQFSQDVDDGYFTLIGLKCGVCDSGLLDGHGNSLVDKVQN